MPSEGKSPSISSWKALAFTVTMLALIFGGIEGALFMMGYPPKKTIERLHPSYWITEANLDGSGFLHKEVGTNFYVSTNSKSLRYREVPIPRQEKTLRVMALGDSTTFGWGVNQEQTYPAVLEGLLKGAVEGMDVQVLNGGVPGYSSFQGLHHMRERVLEYQADIYLFGYIVQDARQAPVSDQEQAIANRTPEFLRANPLYQWRTYLLLRNTYQNYRSAKREEEAVDASTTRVTLDEYGANLRQLAAMAKGADGIPVMFGFPLEVVGYTKAHRDLMAEIAVSDGLEHFDPSQALFEASRSQTLYFPQDRGHPNAAGCQVIAQQTAQWLKSSGLLERAASHRR